MRAYIECLSVRYAKHLVASNIVGRLPNGMAVLAIVLFLRAEGESYQAVGVLSALFAFAVAIGGPVLGRLIDYRGQPLVLVTAAAGSATGFALLAVLGSENRVVTGCAVVLAGALTPPLEPCLRSLWPALLRSESAVAAAYSLDAALQEVIFVSGPLLVVGVIALAGEAAALWATGVVAVAGTLLFVAAPPVRTWRAERRRPDWAGPLRVASFRGILLALACVGIAVGALSIAVVAYGEHFRAPHLAGWLLAVMAVGALIGGLTYGARRWPGAATQRLVWLFGGLAIGYWPLAIVGPPPMLLALTLFSGLFLAPVLACAFVVVGQSAPRGTVTEAFAWVVTVFTVGTALGSGIAGTVVAHAGLNAVFTLPGLASTVALAVIVVVYRPNRLNVRLSIPDS